MDVDRSPLTRPLSRGVLRAGLAIVPVAFVSYFFVYPLARILWRSFSPAETLDLSPILEVVSDGDLLGVAWFSVWQAAVSTVLTLAAALPAAWVYGRFQFPGKGLWRAAITVPFVLPTVVVASAFLGLVGPRGVLGVRLDRTIWIILAAHIFYNYVVVVRIVGGMWGAVDPRLEDAARMLGASRLQTFRRVTAPLLAPAIGAAASIVFLFTFTSFGIILLLGGPGYATLEVEIYRQVQGIFNLPVAASLALLQLVGVALLLTAYSRFQTGRDVELNLLPAGATARRPATRGERAGVAAVVASSVVLLFVPLAVLAERALRTSTGYGFTNFTELADAGSVLFVPPLEAVRNSIGFATAAALIAVVIGLAAAAVIAYRPGGAGRWFDALIMLPLGTSAVTIGFGMLLALDEPIDLRASLLIVPIAHALVAIPFVVRSAVPMLRAVRSRLREAAAVLGAGPAQAWRAVDLPIAARAAAIGAGFAFAVSLGEFGASAFLVRPDTPTVPIAIFRLLSRPGTLNFGRAMAMSVVLMLLTAAAVWLIDRVRGSAPGDF